MLETMQKREKNGTDEKRDKNSYVFCSLNIQIIECYDIEEYYKYNSSCFE